MKFDLQIITQVRFAFLTAGAGSVLLSIYWCPTQITIGLLIGLLLLCFGFLILIIDITEEEIRNRNAWPDNMSPETKRKHDSATFRDSLCCSLIWCLVLIAFVWILLRIFK